MLAKLSDNVAGALEEAERCAVLAERRRWMRADYLRMAESWLTLAEGFATAERVSGFLHWQARREL